MARFPLHPGAVWGIAKEVKTAAGEFRPLLVGGAPGPAGGLHARLVVGGDPHAARDVSGRPLADYDLEGAETLVYLAEGPGPSPDDEEALRRAARKDVPAVCVLLGADEPAPAVPYVLATNVVTARAGEPLPFERILERIAGEAGDKSYVLAAKLPVLRRPVCERIVASFAKKNGVLGAAIFIPGADFPPLTLNQVRMVFRIAAAHGQQIDRERALELLATVGAGLALRTAARQLLALVPGPGWAYKGAVAYAGTRVLGEAAIRYFESGLPERFGGAVRSGS